MELWENPAYPNIRSLPMGASQAICPGCHGRLCPVYFKSETIPLFESRSSDSLYPDGHASALFIFLAPLKSLIVVLLLAVTVIVFALDETIEAIAILMVIVLNALIGFCTE